MNEITPPNEIPCDQRMLASGMFAHEQRNEADAINGPTTAFSIRRNGAGPVFKKSTSHQCAGTSVARKPAITKPTSISFQSICQSWKKAVATRSLGEPEADPE